MSILSVGGQSFTTRIPTDSVVGTVNAEEVRFAVDDSWKGLSIFAVFKNEAITDQDPVPVLLDQSLTCKIPWQVLAKPGKVLVGLVGKDGSTIVKPTTMMHYSTVKEGADPAGGVEPGEHTQDVLDQMLQIQRDTQAVAQSVRDDADRGKFNGQEGPPGKSPIIQDGNWWIWDIEAKTYKDTGIAASGGGGGTTDYNKLTNRPSIGGVLLEGNKTAEELNLQPTGDYAEKTDIPSKLPAPYTLTFAGAVAASYDGSQAVTVTIPTVAGPPGVSPTVATEEIDGGTRVTFTFRGGSETVDILDGITPNLNIGTVETLEPGTDATATITGTPENPLINLGIPRGQNGKTPEKGIDYFTDEEIQAIASQAAALVPGGGGGESKEWKLFQTIDFSEEYADGVVLWEWTDLDFEELVFIATGLTNINESTNSGLQIAVNGTTLMILDTQKKTGATDTKYQRAGIVYNGLYWEPTKRQQSNNEQSYYSQFTNTLSPYSVKTDIGKCERLKLNPYAPNYNMCSGILKVYAR